MPKGNGIPVRLDPDEAEVVEALHKKHQVPKSVMMRRAVRLFLDAVKKDGLEKVLAATSQPATPDAKKASKRLVGRLRDVREVSLSIFGTVPAGWPDDRNGAKPKRTVKVPAGAYPDGAFGLDVSGDSMNKARGKFGPILDGETVVLLPPDHRQAKHGDIVAALCDGQTTLKRLDCKMGPKCVLRAESDDPEWKNCIRPAHELVIQGVVVGKL